MLDGDETLRELLFGRRVSAQAWNKLYRADQLSCLIAYEMSWWGWLIFGLGC